MRTNIDIDDALMERALRVTGLSSKRAAVNAGLKLLLEVHDQQDILDPGRQGALGGRFGRLARGTSI